MSIRQYKSEQQSKKRVYYSGGSAVPPYSACCYDRDAGTSTVDGYTGVSNAAELSTRAWRVQKPATAVLEEFAGILQNGSTKTGPFWAELVKPSVEGTQTLAGTKTAAAITIDSTRLAVVNGQWELGAEATDSSAINVAIAGQSSDGGTEPGGIQVILRGVGGIQSAAVTQLTMAGSTTGTSMGTGVTTNFLILENAYNTLVQRLISQGTLA